MRLHSHSPSPPGSHRRGSGATSGARSGRTTPITHPRTTTPRSTPTRQGHTSREGQPARQGGQHPRFDSSSSAGGFGGRRRSGGGGQSRRPAPVAATVAPLPHRDPQPAATTWASAGLPDILIRTLARRGMEEPFAIQSAALPDAMAGEHLLARAKTGAGKTLGFGLPMLARLAAEQVTPRPGRPRGLILVPTRELATQVTDALAPLAQPMGLKLRTVVGGASMGRQIEQLKQRADVVVATPGRLTDLIERGACDLGDVRITVLDEADHMCDLGFLPAMKRLLALVPADGQRMLFSATLDGEVNGLARTYLPNPVLVAIDPEVSAIDTMEHRPLEVRDRDAKIAVVTELAGGSKRTLVFSRTKHGADRLAKQLSKDGVPAQALHGGLAQNARTRALAAFTGGQTRVLVATDVMARGIHVDGVELVVHADPPTEAKAYLHRSGRTARAGADGTVVVISLPEERRSTERLLIAAGVDARPVTVTVGDDTIRDIAGEPSPRVQWSPEPVRPVQQFGSRGPRRPASSTSSGSWSADRSDRSDRPSRASRPAAGSGVGGAGTWSARPSSSGAAASTARPARQHGPASRG